MKLVRFGESGKEKPGVLDAKGHQKKLEMAGGKSFVIYRVNFEVIERIENA